MNRSFFTLALVLLACGSDQLDSWKEKGGRGSGGSAGSTSSGGTGDGGDITGNHAGAGAEISGGNTGLGGMSGRGAAGGASGSAGSNANSGNSSSGNPNAGGSDGGAASGTGNAGSGGTSPNAGAGNSGGTGGIDLPMGDCPTDAEHLPLVGTWEGEVYENGPAGRFMSMRMVISGSSEQGICGTVTFGDSDPPAPATDPDEPYPQPYPDDPPGIWPFPVDGFPYTITGLHYKHIVQVYLQPYELWTSWCEIQTSYLVIRGEEPQYGCVEPGDIMRETEPEWRCTILTDQGLVEYPGFKCAACEPNPGGLCLCNPTRCVVNDQIAPYALDLLELSDLYDRITGPFSVERSIDLRKVQ
jgi:hypothetical protein